MTPEEAYEKCNGEINKKLEPFIIKGPYCAYLYARDVIKDRWIEAEPIIINDSSWAYYYARNLIKGRWIEAENIISTNSEYAYRYALQVINGKLPENMHNAMIAHGIADPNNKYIKRYLKSKKYRLK
jgi:hypothetical protein